MKDLDSELSNIKELLDKSGITNDRYLFTIKRGWITISIDDNPIIEFNIKRVQVFDDQGKLTNLTEYKWKENKEVKKSSSWGDLQKFIKIKLQF